MRRLLLTLFALMTGIITGMLLEKRSARSAAAPSPQPEPQPQPQPQPKEEVTAAPPRQSRSLEELAPVIKTAKSDPTSYGEAEKYAEYVKTLIDQLIQPDLTEKEAYMAAEELKAHVFDLVRFEADLKSRKQYDKMRQKQRDQLTDQWLNTLDDRPINDDETDGGDEDDHAPQP